jgi:hypothetical protein
LFFYRSMHKSQKLLKRKNYQLCLQNLLDLGVRIWMSSSSCIFESEMSFSLFIYPAFCLIWQKKLGFFFLYYIKALMTEEYCLVEL